MTERRFLVKADEIAERASVVSHPWNPNSEIVGTRLGVLAGLSRIGVNRARIPGGKESFSDFMGFPTPGVAHHLRNPYEDDLVYLVGGESHDLEVADFPRLGKRMIRHGQSVEIYDISDARSFGPLEQETSTEQTNTSDTL